MIKESQPWTIMTSYDFIHGGTGSGNVNRPYVVGLQQGLANAGFRLEKAAVTADAAMITIGRVFGEGTVKL